VKDDYIYIRFRRLLLHEHTTVAGFDPDVTSSSTRFLKRLEGEAVEGVAGRVERLLIYPILHACELCTTLRHACVMHLCIDDFVSQLVLLSDGTTWIGNEVDVSAF
jgi:hypothetical protein